ncbi:hypothetical protein L1987_63648 [Smallanthus sonchifolius]|uniref:Uncharacterized protein n=1 Tax=Smallanthus sonchifolius TaxID=185202 RepID=A0ACB9CDT0_9ASTR|nr:hypothetical protein L1987_63648 [Smallanthus sonchifolius]
MSATEGAVDFVRDGRGGGGRLGWGFKDRRADNAKLCLSCDREVHTTNPLFTKHTRSLLCDGCDSSPAAIFCSTDAVVQCQNCDWEMHNISNSNPDTKSHDRRPIEGFSGCPFVNDLLSILGFEDLGEKGVLIGGGGERSELYGSGDGFPDYLVWETPCFVSLDDLIVSGGSEHNYQAMSVPRLPKTNTFPWWPDSCDADGQELFSDQLVGHNTEANCIVPDGDYDNILNPSHINVDHQGQSDHNVAENTQVVHSISVREINSQEREKAITRYKEKKKSRRYF